MDAYEILEETEAALNATDFDHDGGLDRRRAIFMSLVAAAATTFGAGAQAQPAPGAGPATPAPPPAPIDPSVPPALQFQPWPRGTGALMEQLIRERGAAAFERPAFGVEPWRGAVPTSPEDIAFLPAHRLAALVKARRITSLQLTDIYLERLRRLNPTLLCAVTILEDSARAEARAADAEIAAGRYRGPLHGLPYGVKDLFAVRGAPTTWGAEDFRDRVIDMDAEVALRLRAAGAVLVAKLATGRFANADVWFGGRTRNPWSPAQGSNGSSAGPASATAAGCVAFAIGTETSASIVSPANRCGIAALRPTFGRVSRHGGMVLSWSSDRVGPMARTAEDCAMVFNIINGVDPKDPSTVTTPFHFDRAARLSDFRIGIDPAAPPEVVELLRAQGARLTPIGPRPAARGGGGSPDSAAFFDDYVQRKAKEAGIDLATLVARAPGTPSSSDWNPRFVTGRSVNGLDYIQGQRRRSMLIAAWAEFMKDLDMFIADVVSDIPLNAQTGHPCAVTPYKFGQRPIRFSPGPQPIPPEADLAPQPWCCAIVGGLYRDDAILSVAHQIQTRTDMVGTHRPALG